MTRDEALSALGLSGDASPDDVRAAYRELAQMLHPDKYGNNKRLRQRAEQQMRTINQARDVLLGKSSARDARRSASARARSASSSQGTAASLVYEAEIRARAAEVARLNVVSQLRTYRERRHGMGVMLAISVVAMLFCSRLRGTVGGLGFSVFSMLTVWGTVDTVTLSTQINVLKRRSLELLSIRDRAQEVARQARDL